MNLLFETFLLEQNLDERYAQEPRAIVNAVKLLYRTGIFDDSADFNDTTVSDEKTAYSRENYLVQKPSVSPSEVLLVSSILLRLNTEDQITMNYGGSDYVVGVGGADFKDIVKKLKKVAKSADVGLIIGDSPWTHSPTGKLKEVEHMMLYILTTRAK
jgi:hypothetical protein